MDNQSVQLSKPKLNLFRLWWQGMIWFIAVFAPIALIAVPILPVYDTLSPSPLIQSALEENYSSQTPLCVGMASESVYYYGTDEQSTDNYYSYHQRSYILLSQFFSDPKVVSVTVDHNNKIEVSESYAATISLLVFYIILIVLTVKLSVPRFKMLLTKIFSKKLNPC